MKKRIVSLFVFGFLLFSCQDEKKGDEQIDDNLFLQDFPEENPNREKINDFMKNGPAFPIGHNLAAIRKNFGEPARENVIDRQNIHNPEQTDRIYELFYEGVFFRVYHVSNMDKDIIVMIEVTSEKFAIKYGLTVGSTKAGVVEVLGEPDEKKTDTFRYFAGEFIMGLAEFVFQDDRCTSITWHYFID